MALQLDALTGETCWCEAGDEPPPTTRVPFQTTVLYLRLRRGSRLFSLLKRQAQARPDQPVFKASPALWVWSAAVPVTYARIAV